MRYKKLLILVLIPLLFLTTKSIYALENPIDDVIIASVEYNEGFVDLSPTPNTVINNIDYDGVPIRVLYIAFFDRDVTFRISSGSINNYYNEVRLVRITFDYYIEVPDFLAFITLYDKNNDVILDNIFVAFDYSFYAWNYNVQPTYNDGYDQGYNEGYNDGYDDGNLVSYNDGYNDGYDDGTMYGYDDGYDEAKEQYGYYDDGEYYTGNYAYNKGFNDGADTDLKADIINFVPGVLGAIFMFFFQISQIGILGITILDVLGLLVLIAALIFVIKFFF